MAQEELFVPETRSLAKLRAAAADCKACDLWKTGTQTVFGEGSSDAEIVFVGEQPGDKEDLAGRPFVGPAGRVFDEALELAGIDRSLAYVTNAVKHFKWMSRGKRRIHQKPNAAEMAACKPWLVAEVQAVGPKLIVLLCDTPACYDAPQVLRRSGIQLERRGGRLLREGKLRVWVHVFGATLSPRWLEA